MRLQVSGVTLIKITDPEGICRKPSVIIQPAPVQPNPLSVMQPAPVQPVPSPGLPATTRLNWRRRIIVGPAVWEGNWQSKGNLEARWTAITAITGKENYSN